MHQEIHISSVKNWVSKITTIQCFMLNINNYIIVVRSQNIILWFLLNEKKVVSLAFISDFISLVVILSTRYIEIMNYLLPLVNARKIHSRVYHEKNTFQFYHFEALNLWEWISINCTNMQASRLTQKVLW